MSRKFYPGATIEYMIKNNNEEEILYIIDSWTKYNNPFLSDVIAVIFENSDDLTNEFFDRLIEILDRYDKTEFALKCVRHIIEREKKERFVL